jgi:hypothetical protein
VPWSCPFARHDAGRRMRERSCEERRGISLPNSDRRGNRMLHIANPDPHRADQIMLTLKIDLADELPLLSELIGSKCSTVSVNLDSYRKPPQLNLIYYGQREVVAMAAWRFLHDWPGTESCGEWYIQVEQYPC